MNELFADIGYKSINHVGEQLCGDHVDVVEQDEDSTVIVLADGLGSGVKASILSTLTSKIISTMMAQGISLEECVSTIAATLPVSSEHGVAYSTFSIIHLIHNQTAELIQYDNPHIIMIREDDLYDYPMREMNIEGKKIFRSTIRLRENDIFVAMSDGCPHAGPDRSYNTDWKREDIADFMLAMSIVGYTAKSLCTLLVDECEKLYGGEPLDDATACVVRIQKRQPMNLLFGPPANRDDCNRMMSLFFSKRGKHIICGGTTSTIAAEWLNKPVIFSTQFETGSDVPPMSEIEGVDLVTEGAVTMSKVIEYARDYVGDNQLYDTWSFGKDGACRICQLLFEEATDVNFFVGRAMNPAHQSPEPVLNFNMKMNLVKELSKYLKQMGKHVKISYY